jgi:hypothetical protein
MQEKVEPGDGFSVPDQPIDAGYCEGQQRGYYEAKQPEQLAADTAEQKHVDLPVELPERTSEEV